jgi:hypothetical protein
MEVICMSNNKYQNWVNLFELSGKVKLHKGDFTGKKGKFLQQDFISVNFRMPDTFRRVIEEDLRLLADNGYRMSLNDYLLLLIMVGGNLGQNPEGKFIHRSNGMNLLNYLNDGKKKKNTGE